MKACRVTLTQTAVAQFAKELSVILTVLIASIIDVAQLTQPPSNVLVIPAIHQTSASLDIAYQVSLHSKHLQLALKDSKLKIVMESNAHHHLNALEEAVRIKHAVEPIKILYVKETNALLTQIAYPKFAITGNALVNFHQHA